LRGLPPTMKIVGTFLLFTGLMLSGGTVQLATVSAQSAPPTPPIDLSGVNWTDLARLVYGQCGEYHDLAINVGWPEKEWKTLSRVMYRESRCNTNSLYKKDPNGGSRGLIQINGYWCRPSRYSKAGWLQDQGILNSCEDLFNPEVNLRAGLAIFNYSKVKNKCGWRPWATRCTN